MDKVLRPPYSMHMFWSKEDDAYIAVSPEFEGLSAFGGTAEEAAAELNVAIDATIEVLEADGDPLPAPLAAPTYSGQFRVRLPKSLHRRLAADAEREGVSLNALVISRLSAADAAEAACRKLIAASQRAAPAGERRVAAALSHPIRALNAANTPAGSLAHVPSPQGVRFAVSTASE